MSSINRVVLVGRMAVDPELKYTPGGDAVTNMRIAVGRPFKNAQGEYEADFIDIVCWRQAAEYAANYLTKGRLVGIEGRLQVRSYVTQAGEKRRVYEVVADQVRGLDKAPERDSDPPRSSGGSGGGSRSGGYQSSGGRGGTAVATAPAHGNGNGNGDYIQEEVPYEDPFDES